MVRRSSPIGLVFAAALVAVVAAGCSVGEGAGSVEGTLNVPECWSGPFKFNPDFFAGVPYERSVEIRIQEGGDYTTYSDGVNILVRDIDAINGDAAHGKPPRLGEPLSVRIPAGVTPPDVPVKPDPDPALVELSLYLQRTCKTQNVALYAGTVELNENGGCDSFDGPSLSCPSTTQSSTSAPTTTPTHATAQSTITFTHLFNGIAEEPDAAKRLTEASFDVYLADPRDICPGGLGPPPRCRGHLTGSFRFYFERGRPAQRFP